jgi:hypothetical protein
MCQNHENSGYRARNPFGIRILRVNPSRMKNLEGSQICILLKKGNLLTEYPGGGLILGTVRTGHIPDTLNRGHP